MTQDACVAAGKRNRVLYIDDDAALGRLTQKSLGRHGFDVTLAASGAEGLALLEARLFDVVALDHYMPEADGLEVLAKIRSFADAPPVIYVTGTDEGRVAVAALKAGAVDYVVKDTGEVFFELMCRSLNQAIHAAAVRREKEAAEREVLEARDRAQALLEEVRESRDRAEMLLREVNHRVANSLALVGSLAHLQANALPAGSAREPLVEMQARIAAIAQVHRRLYTSDDVRSVSMDAYLAGLVEELERSMADVGRLHRILLDVDPIAVATDRAVSWGVIVTELVTNACKYAYAPGAGGEVRVSYKRTDAQEPALVVEDDGIGWKIEDAPKGTGLGSKIIKAMAASLGCMIRYDEVHAGTRVVVAAA